MSLPVIYLRTPRFQAKPTKESLLCRKRSQASGSRGPPSRLGPACLPQHCNGVDWRQKLDSQRGAVIATELKNNSYKLARWTCCALLAGSEYLKLG